MTEEHGISKREFDMLAGQVSGNARRVDAIDQGGTRGVGVLQLQVAELIRDVSALSTRMDGHETRHGREAQQAAEQRRSSRRFAITTAIAAIAAVGGLYGLLIAVVAGLK